MLSDEIRELIESIQDYDPEVEIEVGKLERQLTERLTELYYTIINSADDLDFPYHRNPSNKPKRQCGFSRPCHISDALADFLGIPRGTPRSRISVTIQTNEYIKANKLQNPADPRNIDADDKLAALLNVPADVQLSYFNLQKYLKPHFGEFVAVPDPPIESSNLTDKPISYFALQCYLKKHFPKSPKVVNMAPEPVVNMAPEPVHRSDTSVDFHAWILISYVLFMIVAIGTGAYYRS